MKTTELKEPKEVAALSKEIAPFVNKEVTITSPADMKVAAETLSQLNRYADKVKAAKEKITKPLNVALKAAREQYKPLETQLDERIQAIRSAMGTYQLEADNRAAAEEAKIAARVGEGKGHFTPETAVRKFGEIEHAEQRIETESGAVKFRDTKKFEVMDITMLPLEYVLPNEPMIRKAMQDGIELQGVRYYIEKTPINSR